MKTFLEFIQLQENDIQNNPFVAYELKHRLLQNDFADLQFPGFISAYDRVTRSGMDGGGWRDTHFQFIESKEVKTAEEILPAIQYLSQKWGGSHDVNKLFVDFDQKSGQQDHEIN